jgi:hypothetical protein
LAQHLLPVADSSGRTPRHSSRPASSSRVGHRWAARRIATMLDTNDLRERVRCSVAESRGCGGGRGLRRSATVGALIRGRRTGTARWCCRSPNETWPRANDPRGAASRASRGIAGLDVGIRSGDDAGRSRRLCPQGAAGMMPIRTRADARTWWGNGVVAKGGGVSPASATADTVRVHRGHAQARGESATSGVPVTGGGRRSRCRRRRMSCGSRWLGAIPWQPSTGRAGHRERTICAEAS